MTYNFDLQSIDFAVEVQFDEYFAGMMDEYQWDGVGYFCSVCKMDDDCECDPSKWGN